MRRIFAAIGLCTLALWISGCGLEEGQFDPNEFQKSYRSAALENQNEPLRPLPTGLEPAIPSDLPPAEAATQPKPSTAPALGTEPTVTLSLQDIIHRAVVHNHDVRAAGYEPAIDAARVIEAEAHFDPEITGEIDWEHKHEPTPGELLTNPLTQSLFHAGFTGSDTGIVKTGLKEVTPTGAQVELDYQATYNWDDPRLYLLNPYFENTLTLQVTQPLLKSFGIEINAARTLIARDNQKVSTLEFRKQVEETLDKIEKAYWQLVQADADVAVQENLLAITQQTYNVLYQRYQQKVDVSNLEIAQAASSLESRRTAIIQSKEQARTYSDTLKQLMSDPSMPVTGDILIIPADTATTDPIEFDEKEQMDSAMDNRLELTEDLDKIDIASITADVAKNNLLPELDLVGSAGSEGAAGNEPDAFMRQTIYRDVDYSIGVKFDYFLGNREARSIWKRTLLSRLQSIETYKSEIDQVTLDVKTAIREIRGSWDQMVSTRRARDEAKKALDAIQARQDAGEALTPTFVQLKLDLQDRFAAAEQEEDRAVYSYNISIEQLERAKGTLLRYNNVILQEDPNLFTGKDYLH